MIKNLLFDMGGVVFHQDTNQARRRFQSFGIDTDLYMGDFGQRGFFLELENGTISADEFCRRMAEASNRDSISWNEAQYCWTGFYAGAPVEGLRRLLALKEQYHVCLLSNTNPFMMAFTRSEAFSADARPIGDYFHSQFCSHEMKAYKPDAEMYLKALAMDNLIADECLFIDDSEKNIRGAEAVGIHGLHVESNKDWWQALKERLGL